MVGWGDEKEGRERALNGEGRSRDYGCINAKIAGSWYQIRADQGGSKEQTHECGQIQHFCIRIGHDPATGAPRASGRIPHVRVCVHAAGGPLPDSARVYDSAIFLRWLALSLHVWKCLSVRYTWMGTVWGTKLADLCRAHMHCTTSIFECHIVLIENYSGQPDCCKAPANYRMKFKGIRFSRALLTSKPHVSK